MTTDQVAVDQHGLKKMRRKGFIGAILLAILTIIEYFIAVGLDDPFLALVPFVLLKGWIILDTFMHVRALWGDDH